MSVTALPLPDCTVQAFEPDLAPLRHILDIAPVGMAIADTGGTLFYANKAFGEMLGLEDTKGVSGMSAAALVHPEDALIFRIHLARLQTGESDQHFSECRLQCAGTAVWVGVLARLVRHAQTGAPDQIILQFSDIGRQKHAEGAMSTGEARLSYALDAARQGVWDLDFRAGTTYYSGMWREMRGFGPMDFIDGNIEVWLSRVHPDDRDRLRVLSSQQNLGEVGYNIMEYREQHRDGHYIWIFSRGRPIEWMPDGTVARILGTDTDISSLKAVEEKLAEEKERLRITLDSIGDGVISTDTQGRVTFMNPVAERMTGWSLSDAMARQFEAIFCWQATGASHVAGQAATARLVGERQEDDGILVARDGVRREIHCTFSPVRAMGNEAVGQVVVFQDVAQNRELQRKLAHSASHDALTGLPNRLAFEQAFEAAAQDRSAGHALLMIDLDKFKAVNDTAGHAAGDELLKVVAETIRRTLRAKDFASRIGGDEFALILWQCDLENAERIAARAVSAIADIAFTFNGKTFGIGASIGVTALGPQAAPPQLLREQADLACYAAKSAGGSQVVVHHLAAPRVKYDAQRSL